MIHTTTEDDGCIRRPWERMMWLLAEFRGFEDCVAVQRLPLVWLMEYDERVILRTVGDLCLVGLFINN